MNTETVERKSSSYLTPHNPPVSQSTTPGLVDSKKIMGATLTEKQVITEKGVREGDVRGLGGKAHESVRLKDWAQIYARGVKFFS
jgi:hypothetical protein